MKRGFIQCPCCGVTTKYRLWRNDYFCPNCREVNVALYRAEDADPHAASKDDAAIRRELAERDR